MFFSNLRLNASMQPRAPNSGIAAALSVIGRAQLVEAQLYYGNQRRNPERHPNLSIGADDTQPATRRWRFGGCFGTSPSQAPKSRPFEYAAPLPIAATVARDPAHRADAPI
jgi:hypothetical protein